MKIDYGLQMPPDTILHIANDEEFQRLLQPELKAIKDGLIYVEDKDCIYKSENGKYRGYLNAQGQRQGVGILSSGDRKHIGEWHEDNLHGIAKIERGNGVSWWGQYKHGKDEGFFQFKYLDGPVNYLPFKDGFYIGYGIEESHDGHAYRGELKDGLYNGYGLIKYRNNDEYDGQWE